MILYTKQSLNKYTKYWFVMLLLMKNYRDVIKPETLEKHRTWQLRLKKPGTLELMKKPGILNQNH